jgi:sigma-B regulation protein RsbU (phosphoserine phosphatase)
MQKSGISVLIQPNLHISKSRLSQGWFWGQTLGVAIAYYLVAQFSLSFATLANYSTPLWLSAGIGVGAVLVWGYELWLAVLLGVMTVNIFLFKGDGSFLAMITTISVSLVTVAGKVGAAYLIRRSTPQSSLFRQVSGVLKFIIIGSVLSHLPVGAICVFLICLLGDTPWSQYLSIALTWWLSDGFGILIMTPLLVAWSHHAQDFQHNLRKRGFEMGAIAVLIIAISTIAFSYGYPVEFMLIPLLIWTVFRFDSPSVTLLIVVVSLIAVVGTAQGHGSFAREDSLNTSLLLLQSFLAVVGLTTLILYAVVQENRQGKTKLRLANATLEERVSERTAALATANQEISALNHKLEAENQRLGMELEIARQIQQMILPRPEELQTITDLDIAGYMKPADEIGGDYYDILYVDGVVTIGIGDVTGHGLDSGILMMMTQTAVRTLQESGEADPVRFLDILNRTLYKNIKRMHTQKNLTLAILNYCEGKVSISGQHEEVLVVRSGKRIERIDTIDLGFPIGLSDQIAEFVDQIFVEINPGDGIVVYTDGITEAENPQRQRYGMERLCETIRRTWSQTSSEIEQAVIKDVEVFIETQKIFDDLTLVVLKRLV